MVLRHSVCPTSNFLVSTSLRICLHPLFLPAWLKRGSSVFILWGSPSVSSDPGKRLQTQYCWHPDQMYYGTDWQLLHRWPEGSAVGGETCLTHHHWPSTYTMSDGPAVLWEIPQHPSQGLFALLPSGRRHSSLKSCTSRLRTSFSHTITNSQTLHYYTTLRTLLLIPFIFPSDVFCT